MSGSAIKGHQGQVKFFLAGALVQIITLTKVDLNMDSTFGRSKYVGQNTPVGDQSVEGFSGTADCEVTGPEIDDFIDAIIAGNLNGIGADEFTLTDTEYYTDGTSRSYVYFDGQAKMSKSQAGLDAKTTKRLDFQFSGRLKL